MNPKHKNLQENCTKVHHDQTALNSNKNKKFEMGGNKEKNDRFLTRSNAYQKTVKQLFLNA